MFARRPRLNRRGVGVSAKVGGGAPAPPAGEIAITSHTGGETLHVLVEQTISGTFTGGISAVEVFWEGASIGTATLGAGTWSLSWTPTDAVAAFDGDLTAQATGDGNPSAGPVVVTVYSPRLEGNLVLWTDMANSAGFTESGGTLTSLTNLASSVALTLAVAPGYGATSYGGTLPAAVFTGTQYVTTTEAAVLAALDVQTHTVFYAAQYTAAADGSILGSARASGGNGYCRFGRNSVGAHLIARRNTGTTTLPSSSGVSDLNPHVHTWAVNLTSVSTMAVDGTDVTPPTGSAIARTPLGSQVRALIGAHDLSSGTAVGFAQVNLGELVLFSVELSAAAQARVEAYLADKWS